MANRDDAEYRKVMEANVAVHAKIAADYNRNEPQFRPENLARVDRVLAGLVARVNARRVLDLGCGTGFVIDLVRAKVAEIHGVDVTQAMLDQVDRSGPAKITLTCGDAATFDPGPTPFDLVTSYSVLHHLYDVEPLVRTAYKALKPGGVYYTDLEPNRAFWRALAPLSPDDPLLDPIVKAEVGKILDHEVAGEIGVDRETLDLAEYGKNIRGGFDEDELRALLARVGFSKVEVTYHWFVGQGAQINAPGADRATQLALAEQMDRALHRALPLSRPLYKYLGFVATK
jgi:2-polyprenyl-3-methyl-5-hydroxy-6-metoxy-1,4-benzoquinol methylase